VIGTFFDAFTVNIDERTLGLGGAWWNDGRSYHENMLRQFYARWKDAAPFTLLDVGASTGAYALMAAHLPQMTAYAFEPYNPAYQVLKANIKLNHLGSRVHAYPVALSDFNGLEHFHIAVPDEVAGLSQLGGTPRADKTYRTETAMVTTIDGFVHDNKIKHVDVIKVDVEGGDLFVLLGAANTLLRDKPVVIVEYSDLNTAQYGYAPEDIVNFLADMGYSITREHEDVIAEVKA
jgi:FkbM family methyltransferase